MHTITRGGLGSERYRCLPAMRCDAMHLQAADLCRSCPFMVMRYLACDRSRMRRGGWLYCSARAVAMVAIVVLFVDKAGLLCLPDQEAEARSCVCI